MGNNFVENPGGNQGTPARPRSFVEAPPELSRQKPYDGFEEDSNSKPKNAGRTAADVPENNPREDAGNPIGTTTQGTSRRPYSLK